MGHTKPTNYTQERKKGIIPPDLVVPTADVPYIQDTASRGVHLGPLFVDYLPLRWWSVLVELLEPPDLVVPTADVPYILDTASRGVHLGPLFVDHLPLRWWSVLVELLESLEPRENVALDLAEGLLPFLHGGVDLAIQTPESSLDHVNELPHLVIG